MLTLKPSNFRPQHWNQNNAIYHIDMTSFSTTHKTKLILILHWNRVKFDPPLWNQVNFDHLQIQ